MSKIDTHLQSLLDSFTLSQLHELDLSLSAGTEQVPRPASHEAFIAAMMQRYEANRLAQQALRLEAVSPYKHVFLFSFEVPRDDFRPESLRDRIARGFPSLFDEPVLRDPQLYELEPEVCVFDHSRERLLIKYVQLVETWKWQWTSDREKKLQAFQRRHPVVITLRPKDRLMTASFPGYTQGAVAPNIQRTTYVDFARIACERLTTATDIRAASFPLKQTVELLLQKEADNVVEVHRDLRPEHGRMMFDSGDPKASLPTYVASFLSREGASITESQIRELFRSTEALDIVLWWRKSEMLTRIAFHDYAPELLFIWKHSSADSARTENVLKILTDYHRFVARHQLAEALDFIDNSAARTILRSSALAQRFNLSGDEALDILYRGVQRGVLEMVFRVKTENKLADFLNNWRRNLSEFPEAVSDERDETIDLTDNANIEVAFERLPA